jgi:hypothetical protein
MVAKKPSGGKMPWLGIRMMVCGGLILIVVMLDDRAQTFAHALIILLWVMTAFAAMLKEALAYGLGDRVTLFGMLLICAVTVATLLLEHTRTPFLNTVKLVSAGLTLYQTVVNVANRQRAAAPWDGPAG